MEKALTYAQVEDALAYQLQIPAEGRPALAARLRHLRHFGIPEAKPGSGKRVSYTRLDAQELLIALLIEALGCSPRAAANVVVRWRSAENISDRGFIALLPNERVIFTTSERILYLLRNQPVLAIVNIIRAFSALNEVL